MVCVCVCVCADPVSAGKMEVAAAARHPGILAQHDSCSGSFQSPPQPHTAACSHAAATASVVPGHPTKDPAEKCSPKRVERVCALAAPEA